ncbi:hypothetical protein MXB_3691, partial [Myxobolus squamalis]
VNSDDSLAKIALKFHITIGQISTINHLSNHLVYDGMELYIPSYNLSEKQNTDENQLKISIPGSSLFPGLFKPLLLYVCNTPMEHNTSYGLKISRGCIRLGACLFSLINKQDKKSVELTLNPTTISIHMLPSSIPSLKDQLNSRQCDYYCLGYRYSVSLKSIRSFNFFNSMEALIAGDISCQSIQPVHSNDAIIKCESSSKIHRRSRSNLSETFSHTVMASCTREVVELEKLLHDCASPKKDTRKHRKKEKQVAEKVSKPLSKTKHAYHSIVKFFSPNKSAKDVVMDKHKKKHHKFLKYKIDNDCDDSPHIFVSLNIKEGIAKDSISIFRDYNHLYNAQNPQLLFEISQNHVELFREFALENLPNNNITYNDVVPVGVLSEATQPSDITSLLNYDVFESVCNLSRILNITLMYQLSDYFPTRAMMQPITIGYSTFVHGTSMRTLYQNMLKFKDSPSLLIIIDESEYTFGAILSCLPKISAHFYGNGECVLFK